jgi:hypothetical protein
MFAIFQRDSISEKHFAFSMWKQPLRKLAFTELRFGCSMPNPAALAIELIGEETAFKDVSSLVENFAANATFKTTSVYLAVVGIELFKFFNL